MGEEYYLLREVRCARVKWRLWEHLGKIETPGIKNTLHLFILHVADAAVKASLTQFHASVARATTIPNAHPHRQYDCKAQPVRSRLHHELIGMLNDYGLEQVVEEPTHLDNTLDLIITSQTAHSSCSYCGWRSSRVSLTIALSTVRWLYILRSASR